MSWIFATLAIIFLTNSSQAKTLVVAGFDYEPYYFSDGTKGIQGACYEITKKLCELESFTCKYKMMPFRKALDALKDGQADITCPLVESTPRSSAYSFSIEIFQTSYSFFASSKVAKEIKKYEDLAGRTVVVFGPSNTELSLQKINEFLGHKIKIVLEGSIVKVLRRTETNQYPLAYANTDVAQTWILRNRSTLEEIPNLRDYTAYRLAFSKKSVSKQTFEKMQEHLNSLKKSKELNTILEKYKLKPADN